MTQIRPPRARPRMLLKGAIAVGVGLSAVAAVGAIQPSPSAAAIGSAATVWTSVPSTCSPDEASTGRYDAHVSSFKHATTSTGQIVTRCNVVDLPQYGVGDVPVLEVLYVDGDGPGSAQNVLVDLIQARPDGSTLIVARFNSNSFAASAATQRHLIAFTHAFNFSTNAYYVEIRVNRTTTSVAPNASTVRLTRVVS